MPPDSISAVVSCNSGESEHKFSRPKWLTITNLWKLLGFIFALGASVALGFAGASEVAEFLPVIFHVSQYIANIVAVALGLSSLVTNGAILFRGLKEVIDRNKEEQEQDHVNNKKSMPVRYLGLGASLCLSISNSVIESFAIVGGLQEAFSVIPGGGAVVKTIAFVIGVLLLPLHAVFAFNEVKEMFGLSNHAIKTYEFCDECPSGDDIPEHITRYWYDDKRKKCYEFTHDNVVEILNTEPLFAILQHQQSTIDSYDQENFSNKVAYHKAASWKKALYWSGVASSALFGVAMGIAGGVGSGMLIGGLLGGGIPGAILGGVFGLLVGMPTVIGSFVATTVTVGDMAGFSSGFTGGFKAHFKKRSKLRNSVELLNGMGEGMALYATIEASAFMRVFLKIPTFGIAVTSLILAVGAFVVLTKGFFIRLLGNSKNGEHASNNHIAEINNSADKIVKPMDNELASSEKDFKVANVNDELYDNIVNIEKIEGKNNQNDIAYITDNSQIIPINDSVIRTIRFSQPDDENRGLEQKLELTRSIEEPDAKNYMPVPL